MADYTELLASLKGISAHLRSAYPLFQVDADYIDSAVAAIRDLTAQLESIAYGSKRGKSALEVACTVATDWYSKYEQEREGMMLVPEEIEPIAKLVEER